jgi:hypothetical protein
MVPDQQFRIIDALMWNHDAARTVADIKPAGRLNASPPRIPITPRSTHLRLVLIKCINPVPGSTTDRAGRMRRSGDEATPDGR